MVSTALTNTYDNSVKGKDLGEFQAGFWALKDFKIPFQFSLLK